MKLKMRHLSVLGLCAFAAGGLNCHLPSQKYYRLVAMWTKPVLEMSPVDIDNDGTDEIVQLSEAQIDIVEQDLNSFHKSFRMTDYGEFYAIAIPGCTLDSVAFYVLSTSPDTNRIDFLYHSRTPHEEKRDSHPMYRFPRPRRQNASHFEQNSAHLFEANISATHTSYFCLLYTSPSPRDPH